MLPVAPSWASFAAPAAHAQDSANTSPGSCADRISIQDARGLVKAKDNLYYKPDVPQARRWAGGPRRPTTSPGGIARCRTST